MMWRNSNHLIMLGVVVVVLSFSVSDIARAAETVSDTRVCTQIITQNNVSVERLRQMTANYHTAAFSRLDSLLQENRAQQETVRLTREAWDRSNEDLFATLALKLKDPAAQAQFDELFGTLRSAVRDRRAKTDGAMTLFEQDMRTLFAEQDDAVQRSSIKFIGSVTTAREEIERVCATRELTDTELVQYRKTISLAQERFSLDMTHVQGYEQEYVHLANTQQISIMSATETFRREARALFKKLGELVYRP